MNIVDIYEKIPQRAPFLMIDRVLEVEPNESAKGIKCVGINEPYFNGHFPDFPIMPGVLMVEASAQLCGITMSFGEKCDKRIPVLIKIDNFKMKKAIVPGDNMIITVNKIKFIQNFAKFSALIEVNEDVRAEGELCFSFLEKEKVY